jgi:pimeloyl-ACP methyl ester carboxylesterase
MSVLLVVLVSGLNGRESTWDTYREAFAAQFKDREDEFQFHELRVRVFSPHHFFSADIEERAANLADFVLQELHAAQGFPVTLSLVCHSLGGLVARLAAGVIYKRVVSDGMRTVQFGSLVTLGTPHLGLCRPDAATWTDTIRAGCMRLLGCAGVMKQLLFEDKFVRSGDSLRYYDGEVFQPLLLRMCKPDHPSMVAFAAFKTRTFVGAVDDAQVPIASALASILDQADTECDAYKDGSFCVLHMDGFSVDHVARMRKTSYVDSTAMWNTALPATGLPRNDAANQIRVYPGTHEFTTQPVRRLQIHTRCERPIINAHNYIQGRQVIDRDKSVGPRLLCSFIVSVVLDDFAVV